MQLGHETGPLHFPSLTSQETPSRTHAPPHPLFRSQHPHSQKIQFLISHRQRCILPSTLVQERFPATAVFKRTSLYSWLAAPTNTSPGRLKATALTSIPTLGSCASERIGWLVPGRRRTEARVSQRSAEEANKHDGRLLQPALRRGRATRDDDDDDDLHR